MRAHPPFRETVPDSPATDVTLGWSAGLEKDPHRVELGSNR